MTQKSSMSVFPAALRARATRASYKAGALILQLGSPGNAANLSDLIQADPDFARQWVSLLARQLRTARSRVERLSLKSAAERIRHLLISDGFGSHREVKISATLKELARDLGLTHETLYRTLATMERDGQIEQRSGTLRAQCQRKCH